MLAKLLGVEYHNIIKFTFLFVLLDHRLGD